MKPHQLPLVVCALAALAFPHAVIAQEPTSGQQPTQPVAQQPTNSSADPQPESVRRPYRGLFGNPGDPTRSSLDFTASLFGAYDDDLLAGDTAQSSTLGYQQRGWYEGATAGLTYNHPGDRLAVTLDGDIGFNNYPQLNDTTTMYRAGGSLSSRIARHTLASVAGDVVYAPQYRLGLFAGPGTLSGEADPFATVATDLDLFRLQAYRSDSEFHLVQEFGRRATLEGYYSMYRVNYVHDAFDYSNWLAGMRFSSRFTRHLGYHVGYGYSTADYDVSAVSNPRGIHNLDAGIDYSRALSISRRTTFSFSTGSAIMAGQTQFGGSQDQSFYYRFTGDANLRHEIGRTWDAQLGYRRGVDWRETFNLPLLSDAVTGSFGGLVSRRVRFSSSADYTLGAVGFSGANNGYSSASAQAGLEYALSSRLALFARYVYYRYHFESGVVLDPRFVSTLDRQGVRVGISASLPLVR